MLNHLLHKAGVNTPASKGDADIKQLLEDQKKVFEERQAQIKQDKGEKTIRRVDVIKAKVRVFARMNYMTQQLRKNSELVAKIKSLNPTGRLDQGTLLGGKATLMENYLLYKNA